MPEVIQALVRKVGDRYRAQCAQPPLECEAPSLDEAVAQLEQELRRQSSGDEPLYLIVSLYFGPVSVCD